MRRPNRERYLAKTKAQKQYFAAGIPYRYWKDEDKGPPPCMTIPTADDDVVTQPQQRQWLTELTDPAIWMQPLLMVIGSEPTDDTAMQVAMRAARQMVGAGTVINVHDFGTEFQDGDEDVGVFFGYNLLPSMTHERAQKVRDWLIGHQDCLRVLVVAGNPMETAINILRVQPDAMVRLDDQRKQRRTLA